MHCPRCTTSQLKEVATKEPVAKVDVCPACKGMWFDARELEAVLDVAVKRLHVPPDAELVTRLCPRCAERLCQFEYPQTLVKVDVCKKCGGLWLDAKEFTEIKAVRGKLARDGELERTQPPGGVKGALVRFIDVALSAMKAGF